jgi:hypothetical protein
LTVLLRPPGRGNWQITTVVIDGPKHAPLPLEVTPGAIITIAGRVFRVVRVFE